MRRMILTRLVLPFALVAALVAIPFLWLPEVAVQEGGPPGGAAPASRQPTPFQRAMTVGFALILVSVTAGGIMLYRITREQTASWARRFAPRRPQKPSP